jgi:PAS domain S-box-containing protein
MATVIRSAFPPFLIAGAIVAIVGGIFLLSWFDPILSYVLAKTGTVGLALAIFILVWSNRSSFENPYLFVLGIGLFFAAGAMMLHPSSLDGGYPFSSLATNGVLQAWISGGLLAAATAIAAPLAIGRSLRPELLLGIALAATTVLAVLIAIGLFPTAYSEGAGPTPFAIGIESGIVGGLVLGVLLLYRRRAVFDEEVFGVLVAGFACFIGAEIAVALSFGSIGGLNLLGSLLRLTACILFALAIVEFGVRRPYDILFRELDARRRELQDSREYAEGLLEHAPGPILVLDPEGRITRLNRAFERLTGLSANRLVGSMFEERLPGAAAIVTAVESAPESVEGRIVHRDGSIRNVIWSAATLRDTDGRITANVIQGQDVTAQEEAEAQLRAVIDELELSNEGLERYAYVASHDLQEPIRTVVSHVQLFERKYKGQIDEDADEILGYIVEGGLRMQRLIQDLLLLSRVGQKKRPFEPVDCEQVLRDVLRDHRMLIRETRTVVQHDPLPVVCGDPLEISLIFAHLIENAIKFRSERPPSIRIGAERADGMWLFSVADNGIGIEPEYFDRIFVLFQRLHTRERYQGTGVGLPICKKVIERHGGRIWVTSSPEGSTFFFTLPDDRARPCVGRSDRSEG